MVTVTNIFPVAVGNIIVVVFTFTVVILKIGSMCVPVFVKSARASVSDVTGTYSPVRFGQRKVSSLGASI